MEIYEAAGGRSESASAAATPLRGIDVDRDGVIWTNLSGSSHLASFDRRKCKGPLNGPNATGKQCPEGWIAHPLPGPNFKGVADSGQRDFHLSVGGSISSTRLRLGRERAHDHQSNGADAIYALQKDKGTFITIRVLHIPSRSGAGRAWTGASTTLRPVGKAAGCGSATAGARRGMWRAGSARSRSCITSSFVPIPSLADSQKVFRGEPLR